MLITQLASCWSKGGDDTTRPNVPALDLMSISRMETKRLVQEEDAEEEAAVAPMRAHAFGRGVHALLNAIEQLVYVLLCHAHYYLAGGEEQVCAKIREELLGGSLQRSFKALRRQLGDRLAEAKEAEKEELRAKLDFLASAETLI